MQQAMKRPIALLLIIVVLTSVIYAVDRWNKSGSKHSNENNNNNKKPYGVPLPQANTITDPNTLSVIRAMPDVPPDDNNVISALPDLDRQRLEREIPTLLPANESIQTSYKDWNVGGSGTTKNSVEKELYANDAPLFTGGKNDLVPLDINGTQRRVNFY